MREAINTVYTADEDNDYGYDDTSFAELFLPDGSTAKYYDANGVEYDLAAEALRYGAL